MADYTQFRWCYALGLRVPWLNFTYQFDAAHRKLFLHQLLAFCMQISQYIIPEDIQGGTKVTCDEDISKVEDDRNGQHVSGVSFRANFVDEAARKVAENQAHPQRMQACALPACTRD